MKVVWERGQPLVSRCHAHFSPSNSHLAPSTSLAVPPFPCGPARQPQSLIGYTMSSGWSQYLSYDFQRPVRGHYLYCLDGLFALSI